MSSHSTDNPLVVFGVFPELGAYNATLSLAKGLKGQGGTVVYIGPPQFQRFIEEQGFEFVALPSPAQDDSVARRLPKWVFEIRDHSQFMKATYEWLDEWILGRKPALVLIDQLAWQFSAPFFKRGVSVLALGLNFASVRSWAYPPAFCGLVPNHGNRFIAQARNALAWLKCDAWFWYHTSKSRLRSALASWFCADCNFRAKRILERYGGRLRRSEYGFQLAVPELVLLPPELDFPRNEQWKRDHFYAGLGVDITRIDRRADLSGHGEFQWEKLNPAIPLIFCSLGTYSQHYHGSNRFFHTVVEAFRRKPELQLVLAFGNAATPGDFVNVPSNVILQQQAPFLELLKRSSAFITHGGCSSVREALLFGVPMIVFPSWCDQPGNGARVRYHGLGTVGDMKTITPDGLCRLLDEVLSSATIRQNIGNMQRMCQGQLDCGAGVQYIMKHLGRADQVSLMSP